MPEKMVALLEGYLSHLQTKKTTELTNNAMDNYFIPSFTVSPDEWAEFENVYQVHCPKIYMDNSIRDVCDCRSISTVCIFTDPKIMIKYYHCSRARKGLEYHMATRYAH